MTPIPINARDKKAPQPYEETYPCDEHEEHEHVCRGKVHIFSSAEQLPYEFRTVEGIGIKMHLPHPAAQDGKQGVQKGVYPEIPHVAVSHPSVRKGEKPQHEHHGRDYHVEVDLDETVHRVIGVMPSERRGESHGYARRIHHARHDDIGGRHGSEKGRMPEFFRAFHAETGERGAYQIDVDEHVGLDGEKGEDVEPPVVHGAELRVVLEDVTAEAVYYDKKAENAKRHHRDARRFAFREPALSHFVLPFQDPTK